MGTTAEKLAKSIESRKAVRDAIKNTGAPITDATTFASYDDIISSYLVYPTATTTITTTAAYDVTNSKTAQVSDSNLIGDNIVSTASILGVQGTKVIIHYYTGTAEPTSSTGSDGDIYLYIAEAE